VKRPLHVGSFSFIVCLVLAFSWPWPGSASNLPKEESTSGLPEKPYLSLLLLQEEQKGEPPPQQQPIVQNPNTPDKQQKPQGGNPNKPDEQQKPQGGNPNKPDGGNQGNVASGSILPTALLIALIGVVGAAGLWFLLRRRSS
jgi:hypothetical protein